MSNGISDSGQPVTIKVADPGPLGRYGRSQLAVLIVIAVELGINLLK